MGTKKFRSKVLAMFDLQTNKKKLKNRQRNLMKEAKYSSNKKQVCVPSDSIVFQDPIKTGISQGFYSNVNTITLHYIIQREDFVYSKKNGEAESEKEKVKRNNKKDEPLPK